MKRGFERPNSSLGSASRLDQVTQTLRRVAPLSKDGVTLSWVASSNRGKLRCRSAEDPLEEDIECDDDYIAYNTANNPQFNVMQANGTMSPLDDPLRSSKKRSKMRRFQSLDTARLDETSSEGEFHKEER